MNEADDSKSQKVYDSKKVAEVILENSSFMRTHDLN